MDFRRKQERWYNPLRINRAHVERVSDFTYVGVHITEDRWSMNLHFLAKKGRQCIYHLRCLKKFSMPTQTLQRFYSATIYSILTECITAWYGNSTVQDHNALQRVVRAAVHTIKCLVPSLSNIDTRRCRSNSKRIIKATQTITYVFSVLCSGRCILQPGS